MKRIFVMLLIACLTVGVADAQFGKLKGLGKKLEKAAKEKVEKEADKAKEDAKKYMKSLQKDTWNDLGKKEALEELFNRLYEV